MELQTVGIDLGKTSFHLVGLDFQGRVAVRRRFSRAICDLLKQEARRG